MKARFLRLAGLSFVLSATLFIGACHKKAAPPAPPQPPPPPAKPIATLSVSPESVQRGQSVQLNWSTQNATDVTIDPLGSVAPGGTRNVTPSDSTTYLLTANGPGGSAQATARVTVTAPPPPPVPAPTSAPAPTVSDLELFQRNVKDIYFNFDRYDLRPADAVVLKADAEFLAAHPSYRVVISGHCDEHGSEEYNLALGSSRANAVRDELQKLGISSERMKTVSYGKEKPFCTEHNEQCWQLNRRAHFSFGQ
jgi:peptidoglycan-associated lipoprotein